MCCFNMIGNQNNFFLSNCIFNKNWKNISINHIFILCTPKKENENLKSNMKSEQQIH